MVPVALFSRFEPEEMARHPSRAAVLEALRNEPGLTTKQLAARCSMNVGTLVYHLRALEAHGLVHSSRVGRERGWWEAGQRIQDPAGLAALRSPVRFSLMETIALLPGLSQGELAERVAKSKATASHHLDELVRAGLVEARRVGRVVRYYPRAGAAPTWSTFRAAASGAPESLRGES
jgi:DNA-binding transcriptional ArsR family regulator